MHPKLANVFAVIVIFGFTYQCLVGSGEKDLYSQKFNFERDKKEGVREDRSAYTNGNGREDIYHLLFDFGHALIRGFVIKLSLNVCSIMFRPNIFIISAVWRSCMRRTAIYWINCSRRSGSQTLVSIWK
jgi:hypothetical protein